MASKTGWSERFILWELPMVRLLGYEHALARMAGVWTVPVRETEAVQVSLPKGFFNSKDEDDE